MLHKCIIQCGSYLIIIVGIFLEFSNLGSAHLFSNHHTMSLKKSQAWVDHCQALQGLVHHILGVVDQLLPRHVDQNLMLAKLLLTQLACMCVQCCTKYKSTQNRFEAKPALKAVLTKSLDCQPQKLLTIPVHSLILELYLLNLNCCCGGGCHLLEVLFSFLLLKSK